MRLAFFIGFVLKPLRKGFLLKGGKQHERIKRNGWSYSSPERRGADGSIVCRGCLRLSYYYSSLSPPLFLSFFSIFSLAFLLILHTAAQSGCCCATRRTGADPDEKRRKEEARREFIERDPPRRTSQLSQPSGHGILDLKSFTYYSTHGHCGRNLDDSFIYTLARKFVCLCRPMASWLERFYGCCTTADWCWWPNSR